MLKFEGKTSNQIELNGKFISLFPRGYTTNYPLALLPLRKKNPEANGGNIVHIKTVAFQQLNEFNMR